ncbi:tolB protein precursor [Candidatus Sumerlaea chitinivorans]|uniref:TolB protein n=1 Tax=Sumerlaea chitinivorans TaxID=2250252 RepID=A0A2Z4Y5K3_SUMC1|nr:tolB protein precursor [Candidatus Sumerlaea chitinivorans]
MWRLSPISLAIAWLAVLGVAFEAAGAPKQAAAKTQSAPQPTGSKSNVQSLGAVRPSNLVLPQFAVSAFGGSEVVAQVVQNDLRLADVAAPPTNSSAVAAAREQDRASGSVNLDAWAAAGVNYVLRGQLSGSEAQAELYDVASKVRLFGKSYKGLRRGEERRLAHQIADDIITALTNRPGIFSSLICALVDREGGTKEVVVMEPDGGALRQLTNERALVATPTWGKNGAEIYYTSYRDNNPDLYGITLNGQRFEISRRPGLNTAPSWSEAVQRIALSLSKDGNSEIYTMTRDGRDLQRLTNTPDADTAPDWSPDGSQIVFTSDRGGRPQIYVMGSNGSNPVRISSQGYCDSPAWSPDGTKIVYVVREGGEFNLYYVEVAEGIPIQLTRGQGDNRDPSWAPDSRHLVFSSNRSGSKDLYLMSIDTKVAHPIARGGYSSPSWGPLFGR